jgi:hypothetical protein
MRANESLKVINTRRIRSGICRFVILIVTFMDYSYLPRIPFKLVSEKLGFRNSFIFPFKEEPSDKLTNEQGKSIGNMSAMDLFNLFTADIIRKDVLFTK